MDGLWIRVESGRLLCDELLGDFARGSLVELYVDERLIQCYTLPMPASGRIGWIVESGRLLVEHFRLWSMSL
jgi:hypothetical protein